MSNYTKLEVDLDKCSLKTLFEIFMFSKIRKTTDRKQKKMVFHVFILDTISDFSHEDFKKKFIEEILLNDNKQI